MNIQTIQIIRLSLPTDQWDLIIIDTDDGRRGWGEISSSMNIYGVAYAVELLSPLLLGKDPSCVESLTAEMERWEYPSKVSLRCFRTAISGLNQALWDLYAKELGIPLHSLYGASDRKSVKLYANLNKALRKDRRAELQGSAAEKALNEGFSFVKCTPFDEIDPTKWEFDDAKAFEKLNAVMSNVPVGRVAIDCHQRFRRCSLAQTIEKILSLYGNPFWIEDTVQINDWESQRIVTQKFPQIMFAAGEDALNIKQIMNIATSGTYDVIMPDVKYIGGPSVIKSIIPVIEAMASHVSLHNPNGIIATAHSAHLTAIAKYGTPLEFPFGAVPERSELSDTPEVITNGTYVFNTLPGIGIGINDAALKTFGSVLSQGKWIPYQGGRK